MAKVYRCLMQMDVYFDIKADSEEAALDWTQTHDFDDLRELTSMWDVEFNDSVLYEEPENTETGVDISSREED